MPGGTLVGNDGAFCSVRYGLERPGHRHLAREVRVIRLEIDGLLDASAWNNFDEAPFADVGSAGGLTRRGLLFFSLPEDAPIYMYVPNAARHCLLPSPHKT